MERQMKNQLVSQKKAFQEKILAKLRGMLISQHISTFWKNAPQKVQVPQVEEKVESSFIDDKVNIFGCFFNKKAYFGVTC